MQSRFLLIPAALCVLAACGDIREDLGLGRSSPDEFAVVDRPPLSMPPDFSLRPPEPGAPRPQDIDLTARASTIALGGDTGKPPAPAPEESSGEKALLATAAGNSSVEPGIRSMVDRESSEKVVGTTHLVDELLWWRKDEKPIVTVDAPAEAERIKGARDKGDSITGNATPVIERDKSGWLF